MTGVGIGVGMGAGPVQGYRAARGGLDREQA